MFGGEPRAAEFGVFHTGRARATQAGAPAAVVEDAYDERALGAGFADVADEAVFEEARRVFEQNMARHTGCNSGRGRASGGVYAPGRVSPAGTPAWRTKRRYRRGRKRRK